MTKILHITFFILVASAQIQAQSLEEMIECFTKNTHLKAPSEALSLQEAQHMSNTFRKSMRKHLGKEIGYKAGLTSKTSQERFEVDAPVLGVLHKKMLFKSGKHFSMNQGVRLLYEGDLLVKVGNTAINQALSKEEVMQYLESVIPFVEVPDLYYEPKVKITAIHLQTINVGARYGVLGKEVFLKDLTPQQLKDNFLKDIRIELVSTFDGKASTQIGESKSLLGDPRAVIFWMKEELKKQGKSLKKGDLLSLGSITALNPAKAGLKIEAVYTGLGKQPQKVILFFDE